MGSTSVEKSGRLPRHYGRRTLATLDALIKVLAPAEMFGIQATEPVRATVLSFIPFLALPLRLGLPIALAIFEASPLLFGFGRRRFGQLSPEEGAAYVAKWEHGRPPLVQVYSAFHALVLCSFYQQPEVLRVLEVDWASRALELRGERARLLGQRSGVVTIPVLPGTTVPGGS
jgi:hypothetical protein